VGALVDTFCAGPQCIRLSGRATLADSLTSRVAHCYVRPVAETEKRWLATALQTRANSGKR
jgi:hypothetical protein